MRKYGKEKKKIIKDPEQEELLWKSRQQLLDGGF